MTTHGGTRHMPTVLRSLTRGIRARTALLSRPFVAAMTLAIAATSALMPATTQAQSQVPTCTTPAGPPIDKYSVRMTAGQYLDRRCSEVRLVSGNGQTVLSLQPDGNLVLRRVDTGAPTGWSQLWTSGTKDKGAGYPQIASFVMMSDGDFAGLGGWPPVTLWETRTKGFPGAMVLLGDDGDLRVLDGQGYQRWHTNTAWRKPAALYGGQSLSTGQELVEGDGTGSGATRLILQPDGNLVMYDVWYGYPVWSSNTQGKPMVQVLVQYDGNVVGYNRDRSVAYWSTNTAGHPGASLHLFFNDLEVFEPVKTYPGYSGPLSNRLWSSLECGGRGGHPGC
jgi:hypothetical protein